MPLYTCLYCGKQGIKRKPSEVKNGVYCSRSCSNKAQSLAIKNNPNLDRCNGVEKECLFCHKPFFVKPHRYERAKFCSRLCSHEYRFNRKLTMKQVDVSGNKNPNYRDSNNCITARKMATSHYGNKCQICGFDTVINVHHIVPRSSGGKNRLDNLIVLCPNHHAMAHLNLISVEELIRLNHELAVQKQDRQPQ